jgi:hypothetical protein
MQAPLDAIKGTVSALGVHLDLAAVYTGSSRPRKYSLRCAALCACLTSREHEQSAGHSCAVSRAQPQVLASLVAPS